MKEKTTRQFPLWENFFCDEEQLIGTCEYVLTCVDLLVNVADSRILKLKTKAKHNFEESDNFQKMDEWVVCFASIIV